MSLTRKEWEEMWVRLKRLEYRIEDLPPHVGSKKHMKEFVRYMKQQIQSVIGQME